MIVKGDCLEVMNMMPDDYVDLIVTDPPYDIKQTKPGKSRLTESIQKQQDGLTGINITKPIDYDLVCAEMVRICKNINIYIWCNKAQIPYYLDQFYKRYKCSFDIVKWVKTNPIPAYHNKYTTDTEYCLYFRKGGYCMPANGKDASTLYHAPANSKDKKTYKHPTIKPIDILQRLIRNSSKPGDLIFDPYVGSGSTVVAAIKEGRRGLGVELLDEYAKIAQSRIDQLDSNKLV